MPVQTTARVCLVHDQKLLLVTENHDYWYLPGGHQNMQESLSHCAQREVYEETGLQVSCSKILYVSEFYDANSDSHKVEVIFLAESTGELNRDWKDKDNTVAKAQYFSMADLNALNVQPRYLKKGKWLEDINARQNVYEGYE